MRWAFRLFVHRLVIAIRLALGGVSVLDEGDGQTVVVFDRIADRAVIIGVDHVHGVGEVILVVAAIRSPVAFRAC